MNNRQLKWIQETLEGWARWRHDKNRIGWPDKSITGKLLESMPGTYCPTCGGEGKAQGSKIGATYGYIICPTCGGNGRVKMELAPNTYIKIETCPHCKRGEVNGKTCIKCRGSGVIEINNIKINPASIKQTARAEPSHAVGELIDKTLCEWAASPLTHKRFLVVVYEYTRLGRKQDKARKIGISDRHYRRLLIMAHMILYDTIRK
jgi:hypothetical protein